MVVVTIEEFHEILNKSPAMLIVARSQRETLYGLLEESAEVRERAEYMLLAIKEW